MRSVRDSAAPPNFTGQDTIEPKLSLWYPAAVGPGKRSRQGEAFVPLTRLANHWWLLRECRDLDSWRTLRGRPPRDETLLRVQLRSIGRPLLVRRNSTDVRVIWEIFHAREYVAPALRGISTVVDCGANSGMFLAFLLSRGIIGGAGLREYVGVEPDADSFAFLESQVRAMGVEDRATLIRAAASDRDGVVRFDDTVESWGRRISDTGRAEVSALSIASILDRANLAQADLLKLDVEGAEARVLPTIGAWAPRIRCLVCELHDGLDFDWFSSMVSPHGYRAFRPGELFTAHPSAARLDCLEPLGLSGR